MPSEPMNEHDQQPVAHEKENVSRTRNNNKSTTKPQQILSAAKQGAKVTVIVISAVAFFAIAPILYVCVPPTFDGGAGKRDDKL